MAGAHFFEQRKAGASGQLQVQQKKVDRLAGKDRARSRKRLRHQGQEAEADRNLRAGFADAGVFVDDQQVLRAARQSLRGVSRRGRGFTGETVRGAGRGVACRHPSERLGKGFGV
jgi:hypothetical protein